jgi:hypothetical protein
MRSPLLDGVYWSCKSLLAAGSALLTGEGAPRVNVLIPVGDAIGVIWLSLSSGGSKLHGSLRVLPCLLLPLPVVERSASRRFSCGDTFMPVLLVVPSATIVCWSMPVGDAWGVIWLFFSVVGAGLHGLSRSVSMGLVRASKTLLNWVTGRLISARREMTLMERGDLDSRSVVRSFGVAAMMVMTLLVGFSLAIMTRVIIPMVGSNWGEGLT